MDMLIIINVTSSIGEAAALVGSRDWRIKMKPYIKLLVCLEINFN